MVPSALFATPIMRAVLRLIRYTVEQAHQAGIWVGICGELAADPSLTQTFVEMGIDELSMSPGKILETKARIWTGRNVWGERRGL